MMSEGHKFTMNKKFQVMSMMEKELPFSTGLVISREVESRWGERDETNKSLENPRRVTNRYTERGPSVSPLKKP